MKSQFMPLNTTQSGEDKQVTQRPANRGLLSAWKASQAQANGDSGPASMAEQATLTIPAVQGPITDAAWGNALPQNFHGGQVVPQPTPQALFPGGQPYPGFCPPPAGPVSPFVARPFSPMPTSNGAQPANPPFATRPSQPLAGPPSQPLMPFTPVAMPGQMQGNWQGRQPPFVGPLRGQERKKKRRFPIWARMVVGVLAGLLMLVGSGIYYYEANFAAPVSNIVNQQAPLLRGEDNPNAGRDASNLLNGGRINILLLGSDTDAKFQGGYLAQTDIVVTIDPATKTVGMLSIPRDLYVNVPGYGMMKLDEAYYTGATRENNGVGLSRRTITANFGIPINYYAWVGLSGFMKVVDTAGGVDVDATHPITDDVYPDDTGNSQDAYAYKRLYIAPGPQHFDGTHALEYVRSRHADLVGDFGRSARQQQILSQLKTKLTSSPDIIAKLPQLAQDMNGYLKTDMNLLSITQLMNFARTLDPNKIQRVILSPPVYSYATKATSGADTSEDIFVANCAPIQQVIAKMFALGNRATCNVQANSNNTGSSVATKTTPSQPLGPALQTATQLASMSLGGNNGGDLLSIRSLLDMLCFIVFESPIGLQV